METALFFSLSFENNRPFEFSYSRSVFTMPLVLRHSNKTHKVGLGLQKMSHSDPFRTDTSAGIIIVVLEFIEAQL